MARVPKEEMRKQLAAVVAEAPEEMRLVELRVQNIQKVKLVHLKPKGDVIVIGGRNGQGKSSLLQAINYLVCGPELMPSDVIRSGESWATITGQIGPFKIKRYFTRKPPEKAPKLYKTRVTVHTTERVAWAGVGQEMDRRRLLLDMLVKQVTFDPMEFLRLKPEWQLQTLKKMSQFDGDMEALEEEQKADYELRRELRYKADSLNSRLKALLTEVCPDCEGTGLVGWKGCVKCKRLGMLVPESAAGTAAIDTAELAAQLERAAAHNAGVAQARAEKERLLAKGKALEEEATKLRKQGWEMLCEAARLDGRDVIVTPQDNPITAGEAGRLLAAASKVVVEDEIDTAKVAAALNAALHRNAEAGKAGTIHALEEEKDAAWVAWREVDDRMEVRDDRRTALLMTAKMPIEGLTIGSHKTLRETKQGLLGEEEILYNGRPLGQASGAERIRVSLAIGMFNNPKLRVLRFLDGGWDMLDQESQQLVRDEVKKRRYQLWVEHVGDDASTVLMQDGTATGEDVVSEVTK